MKRALITGITGQDGSYLAELLLSKGYEVHGMIRRASTFNTSRLDAIYENPSLHLHYGDLADASSIRRLMQVAKPNEVYNLGAQSHVRVSFDQAEYTANVTGLGALRVVEAVRDYQDHTGEQVKLYQASSSEMFGSSPPPQDELTPFCPRSPYAAAKVFAYETVRNYREAYGLFAVNGILFNHESERRGETFVTRKITRGLARIKYGLQEKLELGNLDARRDWGFAGDYVEAMWLMLQHDKPDDYVVATERSHSVRRFLDTAHGIIGNISIRITQDSPRLLRPSEVNCLRGDASKARKVLNWRPTMDFKQLVRRMVEHDLELARKEAHAKGL